MDEANLQLWDDRFDGANPSPAIRQATVDQREAANPEATSWVAASAGTGKTRVLTNRLLALLLEGAEPRQILALTFTKAAAAEMADRMSEALEEWVTLSDDKLELALFQLAGNRPDQEQMALARRLFARVLEAPGGLNIQTIHAFSQSLLGRFPIEAGVQPGFKVLEDSEAAALLDSSLDRFLVGLNSLDNPPVAQVFEAMGEEALRSIIAGLVRERGRLDRLRGPNKLPVEEITGPLADLLDHVEGSTIAGLEQELAKGGDVPGDAQAILRSFAEWANATGKDRNQNNGPVFDAVAWAGLPLREQRAAQWRVYRNLYLVDKAPPGTFKPPRLRPSETNTVRLLKLGWWNRSALLPSTMRSRLVEPWTSLVRSWKQLTQFWTTMKPPRPPSAGSTLTI